MTAEHMTKWDHIEGSPSTISELFPSLPNQQTVLMV